MSDGKHSAETEEVGPVGLWDVEQAARYLNVSASWLYKNPGQVPQIRLGDGKRAPIRYRKADLDAWLAKRGQGAA